MPIPFKDLCETYGLEDWQCEKLKDSAMSQCPVRTVEKKVPRAPSGRRLSKWQLCIKEEMTGKPFDPQRISELSELYKAGKCPTPEFTQKMEVK